MRLRTLGGLALEGSELRRPKPLALLAYLTLEGPQDRAFLSELFWPHASEPRKSLSVAVAHLRSGALGALGADHDRAWSQVNSDVGAFLTAFEEEDAERVVASYGGPFLHAVQVPGAGAELEEWIYGTREFLAEHARQAMTTLAEHEASHGRRGPATRRAEEAVRLHEAPPLTPQGMLRLYPLLTAGQSPLARTVAAEARELGVDLPETPTPPPTPAVRRLAAAPWAAILPPLVGREDVLEELSRLCSEENRLVSLVGPAGAGKTRLALEAVTRERHAERWDDVRVLSLEAAEDAGDLAVMVADALGVASAGDDPWGAVREVLAGKRCLLVLDNVEQMSDAFGALAELVAACPATTILVTSRRRLGLVAEAKVALAGLPVPEHDRIEPEAALGYGAVALFAQAARRAWPAFVLHRENLPSVLAICRHVAGLPLALCLAASWTRVLSCREIELELERGWRVLRTDAADLPERQRDLRSTLARSWQLLSDGEQRALMGLAAFQGSFTREAAERVASAGVGTMASLLDASLVSRQEAHRFRLHPFVRRFVRERAAVQPRLKNQIDERHMCYVLDELAAASDGARTGGGARPLPDPGPEDVALAWGRALEQDRRDLLRDAVEGVGWTLYKRGRARQGDRLMDQAARVLEGVAAAQANRHRATCRMAAGAPRSAMALLAETLDGAGDPLERAHQLRAMGVARVSCVPRDVAGATRDFREALALYDGGGDSEGSVMMLNNLANLARDRDEANTLAERAIHLAREARQPHALAMALSTRAELGLTCTGEYAWARDLLEEATDLHATTGFDLPRLDSLLRLGEAYVALGEPTRAVEQARRVLRGCDAMESGAAEVPRRVGAHVLLARAASVQRAMEDARAELQTALAEAERAHDALARGRAFAAAAEVALADARESEALAWAEAAVRNLDGLDAGVDATSVAACAEALRLHGEAQGRLGEGDAALRVVRRGLEVAWRGGCLPAVLACLGTLARWGGERDQAACARHLRLVAEHPATAWSTRREVEAALDAHRSPGPTGPPDVDLAVIVAAALKAPRG